MIKTLYVSDVPSDAPVCDATIVGNLIFTTQIPRDFDTDELMGEDITTQTTAVLDNLKRTLEKAGSSLESVAHMTIYLVEADDSKAMNAVYRQYFTHHFPNRATVVVKRLVDPRLLIEIVVVAGIPNA